MIAGIKGVFQDRLIYDQYKLIDQLDKKLSQKGLKVNESHNFKAQETFNSDVGTTQLHTEDKGIYSVEQTWADYEIEELDTLDNNIFLEQLMRFEKSLTQIGKQELENRISVHIYQFQNGTVPGFEGILSNINADYLIAEPESLSARERKFRARMLERFKRMSLMRMHGEYTGNWLPGH